MIGYIHILRTRAHIQTIISKEYGVYSVSIIFFRSLSLFFRIAFVSRVSTKIFAHRIKRWSYAWFVCLRVNHAIYAFSMCYALSASCLLVLYSFACSLPMCMCVFSCICVWCVRASPNVCVMIWFLYQ